MDGSALMLEKAREKALPFWQSGQVEFFELADRLWRELYSPVQAVISSLAIHHLEAAGKQLLFREVYGMLVWGGAFVIADMVDPVTSPGRNIAAERWDEVVRERAHEQDGSSAGLDFFLREHWNTYRYPDPDDIDHPSPLFDQLKWLEQAGFTHIDVHFIQAGHALFSGWKYDNGE